MKKILVSACLCGEACRYDGKSCLITDKHFLRLKDQGRLVPVCPEQLGGLDTPRNPCEIKDGRVVSNIGCDCTEEYMRGAKKALEIAKANNVGFCILKSKSPSCGSKNVYDGTFSGRIIPGIGITAKLLSKNGFTVYDENQILRIFDE